MLSSGTRSLFTDLIGWVAVACMGALLLTNYDSVKDLVATAIGAPQAGAVQQGKPQADDSERAANRQAGTVELKVQRNGHYHADVEVNGRTIAVMVDTGATMVALTYEDAERAGIYPNPSEFTHRVQTANGTGKVAPVTIDRLSIGDITVRNVKAAVVEPGLLQHTLLGMSFLGRLSRFEMRQGALILQE